MEEVVTFDLNEKKQDSINALEDDLTGIFFSFKFLQLHLKLLGWVKWNSQICECYLEY